MENDTMKILEEGYKNYIQNSLLEEGAEELMNNAEIILSNKVRGADEEVIAEAVIVKVNLEDYGIEEPIDKEIEVLISFDSEGYEEGEIAIIDGKNKKSAINYVNNLKDKFKKEIIASYLNNMDSLEDLEIFNEVSYLNEYKENCKVGIYEYEGQKVSYSKTEGEEADLEFLDTPEDLEEAIDNFKTEVIDNFEDILKYEDNDIDYNEDVYASMSDYSYFTIGEAVIGDIKFNYSLNVQDNVGYVDNYYRVINEDYTIQDMEEEMQNYTDDIEQREEEVRISISEDNNISLEEFDKVLDALQDANIYDCQYLNDYEEIEYMFSENEELIKNILNNKNNSISPEPKR